MLFARFNKISKNKFNKLIRKQMGGEKRTFLCLAHKWLQVSLDQTKKQTYTHTNRAIKIPNCIYVCFCLFFSQFFFSGKN